MRTAAYAHLKAQSAQRLGRGRERDVEGHPTAVPLYGGTHVAALWQAENPSCNQCKEFPSKTSCNRDAVPNVGGVNVTHEAGMIRRGMRSAPKPCNRVSIRRFPHRQRAACIAFSMNRRCSWQWCLGAPVTTATLAPLTRSANEAGTTRPNASCETGISMKNCVS